MTGELSLLITVHWLLEFKTIFSFFGYISLLVFDTECCPV
jgi:hypothetical protein